MDLIKVNIGNQEGGLPVSKNCVYRWSSQNKFPQLIFKIAGQLFFDKDEWEQMAHEAKKKNESDSIQHYQKKHKIFLTTLTNRTRSNYP